MRKKESDFTTRIFEISNQNRSDVIQLPINPKSFEMSESKLNQKVTLLNVGEINLLGNRGLLSGSLASFFPSPCFPHYWRADKTPQEYIETLLKMKNEAEPVRLIVTNSNVNLAVTIDKISYKFNEGDGDIYFTIDLTEYRKLNIPTVAFEEEIIQDNGLKSRPASLPQTKEVIVKSSSDTLWSMAVKFYGDGTKWSKIAKANNISDPRSLKLGQRVVIP